MKSNLSTMKYFFGILKTKPEVKVIKNTVQQTST